MNTEERKNIKMDITSRALWTLERDLKKELAHLKEGWAHNLTCPSAKEDFRAAKKRYRVRVEKFETLLNEISA